EGAERGDGLPEVGRGPQPRPAAGAAGTRRVPQGLRRRWIEATRARSGPRRLSGLVAAGRERGEPRPPFQEGAGLEPRAAAGLLEEGRGLPRSAHVVLREEDPREGFSLHANRIVGPEFLRPPDGAGGVEFPEGEGEVVELLGGERGKAGIGRRGGDHLLQELRPRDLAPTRSDRHADPPLGVSEGEEEAGRG